MAIFSAWELTVRTFRTSTISRTGKTVVAPLGDLTLSGGSLFGMTSHGGAFGYGTVFALVVPEPGTLALVGTAAVASIAYRWRRTMVTAKKRT